MNINKELSCEICGLVVTKGQLFKHVVKTHGMNPQDYYDKFMKTDKSEGYCLTCGKKTEFMNPTKGYRKFCNNSCRALYKGNDEDVSFVCLECNLEIKSTNKRKLWMAVAKHLKKDHNMTVKDLYDKYKKTDTEGVCKLCCKDTEFHNFEEGYQLYCSISCATKLASPSVIKADYAEANEIKEQKEMSYSEYMCDLNKRLEDIKYDINQETSYAEGDENAKPKSTAKMILKEKDLYFLKEYDTEETYTKVNRNYRNEWCNDEDDFGVQVEWC